MNKLGRGPLGDATYKISKYQKYLGLPLSEKKNSEICLLCSYARTCDLMTGPCIPVLWRRSAIALALPVHLGLQCLTVVFGDPP